MFNQWQVFFVHMQNKKNQRQNKQRDVYGQQNLPTSCVWSPRVFHNVAIFEEKEGGAHGAQYGHIYTQRKSY